MSQSSIENQRAALRAEAERLAERIKLNQKLIHDDQKMIWGIRAKLRRLAIVEAVGVPGGVRLRCRGLYTDSRLDDATGVVVAVKRTRAIVDWGVIGRWRMPIEDLLRVDGGEAQGCFISLDAKEAGK
jgi:hypothetical protein